MFLPTEKPRRDPSGTFEEMAFSKRYLHKKTARHGTGRLIENNRLHEAYGTLPVIE